jgi:3-oxoacyl-(acyl-carrier-protein) synthase
MDMGSDRRELMKRRRVKITGLGFVTPAGIGKDEFFRNIQQSVSRVESLDRFPEQAGAFVGAEVKGFLLENHVEVSNGKRMPRHTQFALAAAVLAARDAGLQLPQLRECGVLVMIGSALMDFGAINKLVAITLRHGPTSALPASVTDALPSSIGATVAQIIGGETRTMSLQSACCSGLDAIGRAAEMISTGEADIAVCGGSEAPLLFHPMAELRLAGLAPGNPDQPERQCRPFDRWRTTGVIGEGACVLLLEPEESPRPGYAYVEGHGYASDEGDSSFAGLGHAMRLAIGNAGLRPTDIEAVSAWGPGHKLLDAAEAGVMKEYFGAHLDAIPVTSIKGAIGNPLGAAGAIQAGCAALGLKHGVVPPTVNWDYPDPSCPLNLSSKARHIFHRNILVNAHGMSGTNACLLLTQ